MTLLDFLPQTKAEAATDLVAIGAMTSPLWLHDLSGFATDLLPIAGVAWLAVQIAVKIHTTYWKNK